MNYDLSFETLGEVEVSLTIKKVIMICNSGEFVSLESLSSGLYKFVTLNTGYEIFNGRINNSSRTFTVSELELHKIKLQLGL
jgi:hypothetical protein